MDNGHDGERDEEYEYEYDPEATETFLVDLDLSSFNSHPRRSVPGVAKTVTPSKRKADAVGRSPPAPDDGTSEAPDHTEGGGAAAHDASATPSRAVEHERENGQEPEAESEPEPDVTPFSSRIQILDLDTANPIVSYQGQTYSCSWADMVGSNLFFANPGSVDLDWVARSTDDYDLLGVSRIKLVGARAELTKVDADGTEDGLGPPVDPGAAPRAAPNQHLQDQADFLQKLAAAKRRRGEPDPVRLYVDDATAPMDSASFPEAMRRELAQLNQRVMNGDFDALDEFPRVYSQQKLHDAEGARGPPSAPDNG